ncbi:glycosyltransferase family 4 protein [Amaricoccus tamworthensis]|uniref:glycosyltransferase family 4 protein n=1 Tax=Amaricoccus tamworthensis TaxID=57002 RepID=UPI003C7B029F
MTPKAAAFAIPGDINTVTGGYIYERLLLENLRRLGHDVQHLQLGDTFPNPSAAHTSQAIEQLAAINPKRPLILDGLVYGSIATDGLAKTKAPIVAMIHHPLALETGLDADQREHLFRTERDNLALATHVLVPSPHTARILESDYSVQAERITIAPPGTEKLTRRRDPVSPHLILSVGILHPRKGHDTFLRVLSRIKQLNWSAVIAGGAHHPGYEDELRQLIRDLGIGDRVRLAGKVSGEDLQTLYRQASVFALATRYEGYGMVFDEALSWGLPIVSCSTGAVPDTVPKDAGLLVPIDDSERFALALEQLLTDTDLNTRMADAAATRGASLPTWSDTARIAGQVLDRL